MSRINLIDSRIVQKHLLTMKFLLAVTLSVFFLTGLAQSKTPAPEKNANGQAESKQEENQFKIEQDQDVLMLTYFRQRYPTRIEIDAEGNTVEVPLPDPMLIAKLHVALSTDGRHWFPLNDNKPIWDHWMRDPYVRRGPDGLWRILSTGGTKGYDREKLGPACLYATSTDLIRWNVEGPLTLMKDVCDESGKLAAQNIWAPEWFYDDETGEYILIWSSSFKDAGWKESRLWYSRTVDWKNFTPAKVLFEPPYSVIDGTLLKHEGTYYLFHKEEEFGAKTGERRAIRLATSTYLKGPYEIVAGHLNGGQIVPVITEGPTVIKDPVQPGWLLFYDYCMTNRFGASWSPDLIHWNVAEDTSFPPDARHGCVSVLTALEARTLFDTYTAQ
ncbi:glycoside hydrolase family 43 protein [Gaoshiqia sp. Z1-71]|uniref:glycoside hydrolase family 43 protein n=1 Tax=Gaoshiqia hydrogeniformans TaxID=3290090 RepID=UPI003BF85368